VIDGQEPSPRGEGAFQGLKVRTAGGIARNDLEENSAAPDKFPQGAHDGIVFHGSGHNPVTSPEDAEKRRVQGLGGVQSEGDPAGVLDAEEGGDPLPAAEDNPGRFLGKAVSGTAGASPDLAEKELHRFPHSCRLGKRCRPVVKVDQALCPGHGTSCLNGGSRHVSRASFCRQRPDITGNFKSGPPNIFIQSAFILGEGRKL
jgi:hypothetical protein